jgi:hypothetical protein
MSSLATVRLVVEPEQAEALADAARAICDQAERMGSAMGELVEDTGTIPLGDHIARADSTWRLLLQLDAAAQLLMPV